MIIMITFAYDHFIQETVVAYCTLANVLFGQILDRCLQTVHTMHTFCAFMVVKISSDQKLAVVSVQSRKEYISAQIKPINERTFDYKSLENADKKMKMLKEFGSWSWLTEGRKED